MTVPRYRQAAAIVRARIDAGALQPGEPAPSGAELARITGYASLACRRALRTLIADGTLTAGPSLHARPRVAAPGRTEDADATRALSAGLAAYRHAAGVTQRDLAALVGRSVTTVGHAETGRIWQSRQFWENCDKALDAHGALLRLHDAYRAAITADPVSVPDISEPADRTAAVIIPAPGPNAEGDTAVNDYLRKRMLAVNVLLEVPDDIPDGLESELYCYRDKLEAEALSA
jgi:Helix-turn-helix domain/Bacterial regulatory proteins, gntR family